MDIFTHFKCKHEQMSVIMLLYIRGTIVHYCQMRTNTSHNKDEIFPTIHHGQKTVKILSLLRFVLYLFVYCFSCQLINWLLLTVHRAVFQDINISKLYRMKEGYVNSDIDCSLSLRQVNRDNDFRLPLRSHRVQ